MLYREDYQLRVPWDRNPSGWYYWTNVYYWQADTPTDFDEARDEVEEVVQWTHNPSVQRSRIRIVEWPAGIVVQNSTRGNNPCSGPTATPLSINSTLLVWLLVEEGRRPGFKRFRVPVGLEQVNGLYLTDAYIDSWLTGGANIYDGVHHQCLADGTPIIGARVDPLLRSWQWRHGTKRAERIALT